MPERSPSGGCNETAPYAARVRRGLSDAGASGSLSCGRWNVPVPRPCDPLLTLDSPQQRQQPALLRQHVRIPPGGGQVLLHEFLIPMVRPGRLRHDHLPAGWLRSALHRAGNLPADRHPAVRGGHQIVHPQGDKGVTGSRAPGGSSPGSRGQRRPVPVPGVFWQDRCPVARARGQASILRRYFIDGAVLSMWPQ